VAPVMTMVSIVFMRVSREVVGLEWMQGLFMRPWFHSETIFDVAEGGTFL